MENIKEILQDEDRINKFLNKYKGIVYKAIQKTYPSILNSNEKEDWIQEGMLSLYQAMLKFDESKGVKFSAFAYIKIKRDIIKKLECNKNRMKFSKKICSLDGFENPDRDDRLSVEYENKLIDKFYLEQIIKGLGHKLTDKQKEVLEYLLENKKQADIAREMGCSRENIRQIVNLIKKYANELVS